MSAPRIAILPPDVADRIAAGEVVERPASVVKELVENALDAGATSLDLEIREGGRALIRVSDDGSGMTREEAQLAIARHATSKIRDAEDLVGVRSFGFRGEALPAIGSVALLSIETATEDGSGTRVEVRGGTLEQVRGAARRRGTTVSVEQLFYNTPARQKFLRGARSEWRAILDLLQVVALLRRDMAPRHARRQGADGARADDLARRPRERALGRRCRRTPAAGERRAGQPAHQRARRTPQRRRTRHAPHLGHRQWPRRARPRHHPRGGSCVPLDDSCRRAAVVAAAARHSRRRRRRERASGEG